MSFLFLQFLFPIIPCNANSIPCFVLCVDGCFVIEAISQYLYLDFLSLSSISLDLLQLHAFPFISFRILTLPLRTHISFVSMFFHISLHTPLNPYFFVDLCNFRGVRLFPKVSQSFSEDVPQCIPTVETSQCRINHSGPAEFGCRFSCFDASFSPDQFQRDWLTLWKFVFTFRPNTRVYALFLISNGRVNPFHDYFSGPLGLSKIRVAFGLHTFRCFLTSLFLEKTRYVSISKHQSN